MGPRRHVQSLLLREVSPGSTLAVVGSSAAPVQIRHEIQIPESCSQRSCRDFTVGATRLTLPRVLCLKEPAVCGPPCAHFGEHELRLLQELGSGRATPGQAHKPWRPPQPTASSRAREPWIPTPSKVRPPHWPQVSGPSAGLPWEAPAHGTQTRGLHESYAEGDNWLGAAPRFSTKRRSPHELP